jgi:hypothetical protein
MSPAITSSRSSLLNSTILGYVALRRTGPQIGADVLPSCT